MASLNPLALIESIEVQSNYTPDFSVDVNAPSDPNAASEYLNLIQKIQPQMKINFLASTGIAPITLAPYGQPGPTKWPSIRLGAEVVGAGLTAISLYGLINLFLPRKR